MKDTTLWFEDERFWESTHPFIFPAERFAAAEAEVGELAKLTDHLLAGSWIYVVAPADIQSHSRG